MAASTTITISTTCKKKETVLNELNLGDSSLVRIELELDDTQTADLFKKREQGQIEAPNIVLHTNSADHADMFIIGDSYDVTIVPTP